MPRADAKTFVALNFVALHHEQCSITCPYHTPLQLGRMVNTAHYTLQKAVHSRCNNMLTGRQDCTLTTKVGQLHKLAASCTTSIPSPHNRLRPHSAPRPSGPLAPCPHWVPASLPGAPAVALPPRCMAAPASSAWHRPCPVLPHRPGAHQPHPCRVAADRGQAAVVRLAACLQPGQGASPPSASVLPAYMRGRPVPGRAYLQLACAQNGS